MAYSNILTIPFSGASYTGLTRSTTVCEYDATVDAGGNLIDISGHGNTLTPNNTPTLAASSVMKNDGAFWLGRNLLAASNNWYSKSHSAAFNLYAGDFTLTILFVPTAVSANPQYIYAHTDYANTGFIFSTGGPFNYVEIKFYKTGASIASATSPTIIVGYPVMFQVVRKNNTAYLTVDGVRFASINVTGYGLATSSTIAILGGLINRGTNANFLYFRLDSEALPDAQLLWERGRLLGPGVAAFNNVPVNFARAGAACATINGKLRRSSSGVCRVGSDGFVIDEGALNIILQNQALDNATWTKLDGGNDTISANATTAPDGTSTADGIIAFDNDVQHGVTQTLSGLAVTSYSVSVFCKAGNKNWVYVSNNSVANAYAYFNLATGKVGTTGAGIYAGSAYVDILADGWFRVYFTHLTAAGDNTIQFSPANADNDNDFAGDHTTVNVWLWNAQCENTFGVTSPISSTTAAAYRGGDEYYLRPWRLNTDLALGLETWSTNCDQDVTVSGTVSLGGKTFTQAGDTKHLRMPDLSDYYEFDGTGDYLTIADSSFNPTGNFSVVIVYTPGQTAANSPLVAKTGVAGNAGWYIDQSTGLRFYVSADGTAETGVTKASVGVIGQPRLATITYQYVTNGTSVGKIYVDDTAVETSSVLAGPVNPTSADFRIGGSVGAGTSYNGKIHYVAFYKDRVLTQGAHNALYDRFKKGAVLPCYVGYRSNLQRYSQAQTSWSTVYKSSTVRSPLMKDPLDDYNAYILRENADNDTHYIPDNTITVLNSTAYTYSCYVKAYNRSFVRLEDTSVANAYADFNLTTGASGTVGAGCTAAIRAYQNGWYRCSIYYTSTSTNSTPRIWILSADNVTSFQGLNQDSLYVYGAQLEKALLTPYIATTTGAVISADTKKLRIDVEARIMPRGNNRNFVAIVDTNYANPNSYNRILFYISNTNYVILTAASINGVVQTRSSNAANPVDLYKWHKYTAYIDTTDMSLSKVYIDGLDTYFGANDTNWTGTTLFNFSNGRVHVGSSRSGGSTTIVGGVFIRNVRIAADL